MGASTSTGRGSHRRSAGVARSVVFALAGAVLTLSALTYWACRRPGVCFLPEQRADGAVEISPADTERPEPMLRVRIGKSRRTATLDGFGPWLVAASGSKTGEVLTGPIRVVATPEGVTLADVHGGTRGFSAGTAVYAGPVVRDDGQSGHEIVGVDGIRYPGTLRLHPRPGGAFDIVNIVEIERYVPGVLSRELYPHWDEAAYEAQAVAARTYALKRRESARRTDRWYDLDDSQADQVYGGLTGLRIALRAAENTRGVVLIESGRLAGAYYASTCGGTPALPDEVWPSGGAQITPVSLTAFQPSAADLSEAQREVLCHAAPLFRWEITRDADDLSRRIAAWGRARDHAAAGLGRLAQIEPIETSTTGRRTAFELADRRGRAVRLTAEQLRAACNYEASALPLVAQTNHLPSGDVTVNMDGRDARFDGRGAGHGVGLCQYCAQAMAGRGDEWRRLLRVFYPDAEPVEIY